MTAVGRGRAREGWGDDVEMLRVAGLCRVEVRLFELEQGAEAPAEDGAAARELASRTVYLRADRFLELSSTVNCNTDEHGLGPFCALPPWLAIGLLPAGFAPPAPVVSLLARRGRGQLPRVLREGKVHRVHIGL